MADPTPIPPVRLRAPYPVPPTEAHAQLHAIIAQLTTEEAHALWHLVCLWAAEGRSSPEPHR